MGKPGSLSYVAATLGLMAATATITYCISHDADVPTGQLAPSNATCMAYMEADQRYETKRREFDEKMMTEGQLHTFLETGQLPAPRAFLGKADRREAYLQAYGGVKSSDPTVMTRLLNADRWRCCKRLEPNRRACPVAWLS